MRLSERAFDFFGQEQEAGNSQQIRRVLENKPLREKKQEIQEILEKTEEVTGVNTVFDEVRYSGSLKGRNVAMTSGRRRVRMTVDDTFYGFPEALQIMVAAHENVHALDRKSLLKKAVDEQYGAKDVARELKSYMSGSWRQREASTHLLATKMLGNDYFMGFRGGVEVKPLDDQLRNDGFNTSRLKKPGKAMETTQYTRSGMVMFSNSHEPDSWGTRPSEEDVRRSDDWMLLEGGEPLNSDQMLDYRVVDGWVPAEYDLK
ncbi:MAG: hypothetical protein ABEJ98_02960 [Candidatus Nanohaloarchaea archaeon]